MAAVLAAILAAFLAGAIALYREWRLEKRRLRVAARVVQQTLAEALNAAQLAAAGTLTWDTFALRPSRDDITRAWDEHRDVLAGHLSRAEWMKVQTAVGLYLVMFFAQQDTTPDAEDWDPIWQQIQTKLAEAHQALDAFCD